MNASAATRLLAPLLAVSLLGNVALFVFAARSRPPASASAPASTATTPSAAPGRSGPAKTNAAPAASPEAVAALSRALAAPTLDEFRDLIDAAGVTPKLRRELLRLLLQDRQSERAHAIYTDKAEIAQTPWWRDPDYRALNAPALQRERQRAGRELQREFDAELTRLLGIDTAELDFEDNPWLARQVAGLPADKARALHKIQQDYNELEWQISADAGDFQLPSDREKLELLRLERERDIAALLTPEERAAWELRTSPAADYARSLATRYHASEEEYMRLYELIKNRETQENLDPGQDWRRYQSLNDEHLRKVREIIGDERFRAGQREADPDFSLARSAADRLGLPESTAADLYARRESTAIESQKIVKDSSLTPQEKREALARLATQARDHVERVLGAEAAQAYFEQRSMGWLDQLTSGSAVIVTDDGIRPGESVDGEPDPVPVRAVIPSRW